MATPDITPYVDLTFFDKDPQDIYEAGVAELSLSLPEWIPREGNVEVALLEAMSLQVAEAIFAINRLPGAITQAILRLYGLEPDVGEQPTTTLTFTLSESTGHTIPAETRVRIDLPGGLEPVVFYTDDELIIAPGSTTGTVAATGDRFTDEANGIAAGTVAAFMDAIIYVNDVALASPVTGGVEPETDEEWIDRAMARFARLSEVLVLPVHFSSFALDYVEVSRAFAIDLWDATGAPGADGGHITVAVYGDAGALSADFKTALAAAMDAASMANLVPHVIDPTLTAVAVTVTVALDTGAVEEDVQLAVADAVQTYLSPQTWDWSGTVRRNELITLITNVEGVAFVETLAAPAADVALTGYAVLANAGTITVNGDVIA